jgi:hypothetical protein
LTVYSSTCMASSFHLDLWPICNLFLCILWGVDLISFFKMLPISNSASYLKLHLFPQKLRCHLFHILNFLIYLDLFCTYYSIHWSFHSVPVYCFKYKVSIVCLKILWGQNLFIAFHHSCIYTFSTWTLV